MISELALSRNSGVPWFKNVLLDPDLLRIEVCANYLEEWLGVPKDCRIVYIVFTNEEDPEAFNFRIAKPQTFPRWYSNFLDKFMQPPCTANLSNYSGMLLVGFRNKLGAMHEAGYRYLHVEYDHVE